MEFNKDNAVLGDSVANLPKDERNIPLYLNILATTDNAIIRGEMAYLLSQMCPENKEFKSVLVSLIKSPKTEKCKGCLLYPLSFLDYSDDECIDMLCEQLYRGNFECMSKAYDMLNKLITQDLITEKEKLRDTLEMMGENTDLRLDMIQEVYDNLLKLDN